MIPQGGIDIAKAVAGAIAPAIAERLTEADLNGDLAAGLGKGVGAIAVIGDIDSIAILIGDSDLSYLVAIFRLGLDGYLIAILRPAGRDGNAAALASIDVRPVGGGAAGGGSSSF